jgi:hypothetical protein
MNLVIYERPSIYLIIHVSLGVVSFFYTPLLWAFLVYQLLQLTINKRFFIFEWRIKNGNSVEHTVVKLLEFFAGFLIGKVLQYNKFYLRI